MNLLQSETDLRCCLQVKYYVHTNKKYEVVASF